MGRLDGKNCIVTGAAGGIGLETSILLAQNGGSVLMADSNEVGLAAALDTAKQLCPGAKLISIHCDVKEEKSVERMVTEVDSWGGVDVMFNNAGIMHKQDVDAVATTEAAWDEIHKINVKGVWYGCKHAILSFRRHKKTNTSVINTASVVALMGSATAQIAYTASKGAVLAMTRELAMVHAREGFRFNSLCPAPLNTPLLEDILGSGPEERNRREIHFPSGRFGEAIEQAHVVVFLASDESSFIIGQEIVVDGGMTKAYITPEGPPLPAPLNNAFNR
jgi:NAD(P)-dependent dehydrogenase (short-subunit alcohol dehydrogenase family)